MDEGQRIVHEVLDGIAEQIRPGVTTHELDIGAERTIRSAGAVPAFLNYRGFPATLCALRSTMSSCMGSPTTRPWLAGDIIGVDCGVLYKGYYGDAARTFAVGEVSNKAHELMTVTREALGLAVEQVQPGNHLSDIGHVVQKHVRESWVLGGQGVCGPWNRRRPARGSASAELWQPGKGSATRAGSRSGDRADGQCRSRRSESRCRWLDGADAGWQVVGTFRSFRCRHRKRPSGPRCRCRWSMNRRSEDEE